MKSAVVCCLLFAAAVQAVDWANVKPIRMTRPSVGYPPVRDSGRIIGGSLAEVGQFKYQAGMLMDNAYFCGGSLVTDSMVLTAAHCIKDIISFEVHLGATQWSNAGEAGRVAVTTTDAVMHERYLGVTISNDIGFIRLGQSVSGPNIETVRLPSHSQVGNTFVGVTATVSGWGKPSDAAPGISDDLKYAAVTVITNEECALTYGNTVVGSGKICVDTAGGTQGSCNGDSGGPLVITEDDGIVTEIGIVSFGSSAGCESGAPAAFSRITEYLTWLETKAGLTFRP